MNGTMTMILFVGVVVTLLATIVFRKLQDIVDVLVELRHELSVIRLDNNRTMSEIRRKQRK